MKPKYLRRPSSFIPHVRLIATPALAGLAALHCASAAITTWSGAGEDENWSTSTNWNSETPAGNDVVFAAADATGTTGLAGTPNNIVDANTTITSLRYNNIQPGNHTTEIPAGVTLTINGGGTNLQAQSTTTTTNEIVYATILGEGRLVANNTAATLYVGQGSTNASTSRRATLDLSGLSEFSATLSQVLIGRQATSTGPNRPQGTLKLALANTLDLTANPGIYLGDINQNNGTPANAQILELGLTNTILSDNGLIIGGKKGNGYLRFNSQTVEPGEGSVTFRNRAGTGRQANWIIGDNSTQSGGGTNSTGSVDFSTLGTVDALVGNIILGRGTAGTVTNFTIVSEGSLSFDSGIIDANTLTAGTHTGTAVPGNALGTVNVNGTGKLLIRNNATLGRYNAGSTFARGILNIGTAPEGGGEIEIRGDVLCGLGSQGNKITVRNGGTLQLGGTLGRPGTIDDTLETLDLEDATLVFNFGATSNPTEARAQVQTVTASGNVEIGFSGSKLEVGTIKLIDYGSLEGDGFPAFTLIPTPGIDATLVHNTVDGSIDLNITALTALKWTGNPNGNWDIGGTANWLSSPGDTPSAYLESGGSGSRVILDDSATGTKTVNLTTTVSPLETFVNTTSTYTLTGTGAIAGTGMLVKQGTGTLLVENSGQNTFTGVVDIEDGTLRLAGDDNRLPVSAAVIMATAGSPTLDLNGTSQTITSLQGGGLVRIGSGTLTVTDAGDFSGILEGSGSLVKSVAGTLILSGENTYSGGTTISGGRITLTNAAGSGLGSGPVTIAPGGSLSLGNGEDNGSIAATTIANDGLVLVNRSDDLTLETEITGLGGLTKNGEGSLLLENENTYAGVTTINAGALHVSHPGALGSAEDAVLNGTIINNPPSANLALSGGITLAEPIRIAQKQGTAGEAPCLINLDGHNTLTGPINLFSGGSFWNLWSESGKLTIAGTATNTNTTNIRVLRFFGEGDGEFLTGLANGAGTSLTAVVMNGAGTWRLAGENTYTGTTTVETGTLQIDGSLTTSTITVQPGARLSGTGTLGTVNAMGTIAPGGGIGTLSAANVTLTGTLALEIAGSSADRLSVSGTLDLTNAALTVSGTPTAGSYTLASAGTLIGTPTLAEPVPGYELVIEENTIKLNSLGGVSAYEAWANGEPFGTDANGDGISNGLAFLLGAASPQAPAGNLLPKATQTSTGLVLTFSMRNAANRGTASLLLEHSSDLGITDAWTSVTVPEETAGPLDGVRFVITPGDPTVQVEATIDSSQGPAGKLFGRLQARENP
jgi:fibronectin-binding autotransporter adhesin